MAPTYSKLEFWAQYRSSPLAGMSLYRVKLLGTPKVCCGLLIVTLIGVYEDCVPRKFGLGPYEDVVLYELRTPMIR
jgi:hypothetical protein